MPGKIIVGTASWTDPGFIADWYPKSVPPARRLEWYSGHFSAVEVNSTFYALPQAATVEKWVTQTPDGFIFDLKLPKLLSYHSMDLTALPPEIRPLAVTAGRGRVERSDQLVEALVEQLAALIRPLSSSGRLGTFLLQLSPAFSPRTHKLSDLTALIEMLPLRPAIEFRHRGWMLDDQLPRTLKFLQDHQTPLVNLDAPPGDHFTLMPTLTGVTTPDLAYFRAHGRNTEGYLTGTSVPERFDYEYSDAELDQIKSRVDALAQEANNVHVYFNNNRSNFAPRAASRLQEKLGIRWRT